MKRWNALPDLRSSGLVSHYGPGSGLFHAERIALAAALRELPGEWFFREHEARGQMLALVLPRDEWDKRLPLFLLWRGAQGLLHLCMGQGPDAVDLGCFSYIKDLTDSLEREVWLSFGSYPGRDRLS